MLKAIHCDVPERAFHKYTDSKHLDELGALKDNPQALLWLDLLHPTDQDLATVAEKFHLHPLAVEDASVEHQRPKVDEYEEFVFIVFYVAHLGKKSSGVRNFHEKGTTAALRESRIKDDSAEEEDEPNQTLQIGELDIFLGKNYIITVHNEPMSELDEAEHRWMRNEQQVNRGVGMLLYSLIDTIVDQYFPIVDALVDQADELEERLFSGQVRETKLTHELLQMRREFLKLRRIVTPERDVLNILTNFDSPRFNKHVIPYFRDVYDHITRVADTIDLYRDQLSTTMDANLSIVSNNLNKVMRTLTVASIILMVDSLIAGIYGMNFDIMPELHLPWGYFGVLVLMLLIAVGLIILFRRMRWL